MGAYMPETPLRWIMLTVMSGLAAYERSLILARTSEGRARAKANGIRFGRKPKLSLHQQTEAIRLLIEGQTQTDVAKLMGVNQTTISAIWVKRREARA